MFLRNKYTKRYVFFNFPEENYKQLKTLMKTFTFTKNIKEYLTRQRIRKYSKQILRKNKMWEKDRDIPEDQVRICPTCYKDL